MKFPKIDSPCPIRWNALPTAEKNFCTQCERKVHNLSGMTEVQRRQFLASCNGKVCIAYTVPHARPMAAMRMGLGMLAALAAAPAMAEDTMLVSGYEAGEGSPLLAQPPFVECDDEKPAQLEPQFIAFVGGVSNPGDVRWVEADAAIDALPTVSDSAFLEGDDAEFVEFPPNSRP